MILDAHLSGLWTLYLGLTYVPFSCIEIESVRQSKFTPAGFITCLGTAYCLLSLASFFRIMGGILEPVLYIVNGVSLVSFFASWTASLTLFFTS